MSTIRDESTRVSGMRYPLAQAEIGVVYLDKAGNGLNSGAYFGPLKDIKLFHEQTLGSNDVRMDVIPILSFLWVVVDGAFRYHRNVYLVNRTGNRSGCPLFDVRLISPHDLLTPDSRAVPRWVALRLGVVGVDFPWWPFDHLLNQIRRNAVDSEEI